MGEKVNILNAIIEKTDNNYCACIENLNGFVCTSDTLAGIKQEVREGLEFHLDGMIENNNPIPSQFKKPYKINFKIK